ncbi:putative ABC transport system permease protein [Promicromonospora umidemergens]|uniref:FtsX-like permease family protein n=1 Tax=Promicromonospora umidemergens TaxID=629679 RepID=A0ABP8WDR5_9MICO|nr:FtsX-like permease family protein [Promicromonospora umidemergens]MCP2284445.1 putative ABC transport system permease protein [Promicromonospora umidemergens]
MLTADPTTRVALGQMRRSIGRLAAAGLAIVISTAFVAATLQAGTIITRTTYAQVAAQYADADLVVFDRDGTMVPADTDAVRAVEGVAAADGFHGTYTELNHGSRTVYQSLVATPSDPRLSPLALADGTWADGPRRIVLPVEVAELFGVGVGDSIASTRCLRGGHQAVDENGAECYGGQEVTQRLTVSGLVDDPLGTYAAGGGVAVVSPAALERRLADDAGGAPPPGMRTLVVALDRPGDQAAVEAVKSDLAAVVPSATGVTTPEEYAEDVVASISDGQNIVYLVFALALAAVSLVVAGLVIANTLQVLVAQRSHTLALLRCVGASTGQVYRSVLLEAAILGAVASVAGVVVGSLFVRAGLLVAPGFDLGVELPRTITPSPSALLVPLAVGLLVTLVAALAPARAASRVAPLAALRPAQDPGRCGTSRARALLAGLATVGGFVVMAGGVALGTSGSIDVGLFAAILGGSMSLVGVIAGSVFWLPRVAAAFGRFTGAGGPAARLASANTLRNPRRTAATSTALLIGVTLVSMMTTGAASARVAMDDQLDARFPVDLQVTSTTYDENGQAAVPATVTAALDGVDGLRAVTEVTNVSAERADEGKPVQVAVVEPEALRAVANTPADAELLRPGTIVVPERAAALYGLEGLDTLELTGPDGEVTLDVAHSDSQADRAYLTPQDLAAFAAGTAAGEVWAAVDDDQDAGEVVSAVQEAVSTTGETVGVAGIVVERSAYQEIVDAILAIVVGLLAVAVVIALIGVANTLSLSVMDRSKENAVLRAIGLSRRQLRATLAVEGLVIAAVGAVLGVVLGLLYGWAGAATALSTLGTVPLVVPWTEIAVVLGAALVAGLIASVVPAQAAARTRPVAALAAE